MSQMTPAQFFAATPAPPGGSSSWAAQYGRDLREVIVRQAHRLPRTVQRRLGPSELGSPCDRQVISKLIDEPVTNHVADPWPSVVGTAVHAQLAKFFDNENALNGTARWITETKVHPHPDYPGTSDIYDTAEKCVVDFKIQGPTSQAKTRSEAGPMQRYVVQLLLYAWGWRNAGFEVKRVAIASLPRTSSSLADLYVWEKYLTPEDDQTVIEVLQRTEARRITAQLILSGQMTIGQVPRTSGGDECYFCGSFRPEAARDGDWESGCPGHSVADDAPYPYPGRLAG